MTFKDKYAITFYHDSCPSCSAHGFSGVAGDPDVSCTNCGKFYAHISRKPTAMMTEQLDMVAPMMARLDAVVYVGAKKVSVRWLVAQYGWLQRELEQVTQHLATAKRNEEIMEEELDKERERSAALADGQRANKLLIRKIRNLLGDNE